MPTRRSAPLLALAVLAAIAVALVVAGAAAGTPQQVRPSDPAARSPVVTGYALAGDASPSTITRDGTLVDTVGVDGVVLSGPARVSRVDPATRALRDAARRAHRASVLLISNYSDRLGDFDEHLAHRMLDSRAHRWAVARALVARAAGFDGVQLDLESLTARDRRGLTAFTRAVRRALPATKSLSMAFMASSDAAGYRARGYDLSRLGPLLDVAVLMTYDLHGPWSGAGPIAAMPWVRRELAYFVGRVPRGKVDLGAAAYGYQWGGGASQLTVPQARKLAGAAARWSAADGEWYAALANHRVIWWDDARSVVLRRRLAVAEGLHGLAIWQLGSSGDLTP